MHGIRLGGIVFCPLLLSGHSPLLVSSGVVAVSTRQNPKSNFDSGPPREALALARNHLCLSPQNMAVAKPTALQNASMRPVWKFHEAPNGIFSFR